MLTSVTVPVCVPLVVVSKPMFSVADCPGLRVAGNVKPEMLKPVPVTDPELMVRADVPVELISTDCVDAVFRVTVPNETLVLPTVHAELPAPSCSDVALLTPPAVAVMVAVCVVLTALAVAVNDALTEPAGTVVDAGTLTEVLLLARVTANPPLGAAAVSVTEHASDAAPVSDPLLHDTALSAACEVNCSAAVLLAPAAVAVIVAVCVVLTADVVAVKAALVAPAATVTDAGTDTAELLLASVTASPPLGAAAVRATVHASDTAPVTDPLLHETPLSEACAAPVPLSAIVAVPPLAALLTSVTVPLSVPAAVGSNPIVRVALCPGFSVTGNDRPDMLKPVPATEPELIVSAALPVELISTVFAVAVFKFTLPNARLLLATVHAGAAAFNCSDVARATPAALAVTVAVCAVLTAEAVAMNAALALPEGTITEAGTATAELLLASATAMPALGAAAVSVTEHASDAAPVTDALLHEIAPSAAVGAGGVSCSAKLELPLLLCACRVAVCAVETADTLAANVALFAPLATVTDAGT